MSAFANAANKLGAPSKKSIFERQKEEAEAKKAREKAETAAAYDDFVKSFEGDGDAPPKLPRSGPAPTGGSHGLGKRHFTGSGLKSGPGSLEPAPGIPKSGPGSLGSAFGKKRPYDDFSGRRDRDRERERERERHFSYEQSWDSSEREAFDRAEEERKEEEDKAAARPTLHLSSLPPGTSPAVIKALFTPSPLTVENVRILPGSTADRKALSAIVTLTAETPSSDIDTMVSHLQNKYLGYGFNLSISRHLSSAALSGAGAINAPGSNVNNLAFGARPIPQHTSLSRAPPPGQSGRFAPPASYTSSTPYSSRPQSQVIVQAPSDLKQLKLIHKTLEALLTYGPEFEALLMSRPQIQRDPEWAWLWNPRSQGGVYYRWRLWEILSNSDRQRTPASYGGSSGIYLFENQSQWIPPESLKFEYTTQLSDFVSDEDYNSSDEEDNDDNNIGGGLARRHNDHHIAGSASDVTDTNDGLGYLNPLAKAKLVHLLSRLPDSNAKLRKGDVARITAFAIEHAGAGADEVAELVTRNVIQPFSHRPQLQDSNGSPNSSDEDHPEPTKNDQQQQQQPQDKSPSSLIALYLISDILSASSSAGVRHAWRYRSLFETSLRNQSVFEKLGRYEREMQWGKLKAEKWKRAVSGVLGLWEGWCIWRGEVHEEFVEAFNRGPVAADEGEGLGMQKDDGTQEKGRFKTGTAKWKTVDASAKANMSSEASRNVKSMADGELDVDVDGTAMPSDFDDDIDDYNVRGSGNGITPPTEDLDGVPMQDSSDDEEMHDLRASTAENQLQSPAALPPPPPPPPAMHEDEKEDGLGGKQEHRQQREGKGQDGRLSEQKPAPPPPPPPSSSSSSSMGLKRQRPRAVDMFADEEDD